VADDQTSAERGSVQQVIETFESILEAFPEDVSALESLIAAHEQAGHAAEAETKARALLALLRQHGAWDRAHAVAERILVACPEDAEVAALRDEAAAKMPPPPVGPAASETLDEPTPPASVPLKFDLSGELDLAWSLLQNEVITQEQYEAAIAGLTEARMSPNPGVRLSLLQELASMDRIYMDRVVGFLSAETGTPYIDLSRFEIDPDTARAIPIEDSRRLGVLVFESIRDEVMVAVLNPVDENLRKKVSAYLGCKAHFYLTSPEEFQAAIDELAKVVGQ